MSVKAAKAWHSKDAELRLFLVYLGNFLPCDNIWKLDFKVKTNQGDWVSSRWLATNECYQNLYKYPETPQVYISIWLWHLRHTVCSLTCCCLRELLQQATVTYNSLMATKRIQSESPALGPDGQYLLHRVESHGRRLIGKAMTDSLRYAERWEKRTRWRGYQFEFHSRGVVLSKDVTHMILVNKRSQMDVESVTKQKCKAWNCTDKRKWKRGTNALSMHGYPVLRWDLASLF